MISGNEREQLVFKNYVGLGKITVLGVNMDTEDKDGKEIEYVKSVTRKFKGIDEEGNVSPIERECREVSLVFKLQVEGVESPIRHTIRLYNVENVSYKDYANTGKIKSEWINSTGNNSWAFEESELKDKFTKFLTKDGEVIEEKKVRKALVGETELFTFLNAWIGDKIRKKFVTWDYDIDVQKFFKGNFKALSSFVGGEFDSKFVGMFYVETSEDGEKNYQKLFGKAFLKMEMLKYINNGMNFPDKYSKGSWDYFVKQVESPDNLEYALKGFYTYSALKEYDPAEDIASAKKEMSPENADY
jgi:hypothetical protein